MIAFARPWIAAAVLAAAAAGCTRGAGSLVPAAPGEAGIESPEAVAKATVVIKIPVGVKDAKGALIRAFKLGHRTKPSASVTANVGPVSHDCHTTKTGRLCSIALALPSAATYAVAIDIFDRKPRGGKIPPTARETAAGTAVAKVKKNTFVHAAIGGIVGSTSIALPVSAGPAIDPLSETATVAVLDPDGNAILTKKFVDLDGKPVTIAMKADTNAGATIQFTPASFGSPVASVALAYLPGKMNSQQATNGFATVLSAAASNGAPATPATLTLSAPQFSTRYLTPTANSHPFGLTNGPDGALWFTEFQGNNIGRITTAGTIVEYASSPATGPVGIVTGSDGNLWFTGQQGNAIGKMTPSGTLTTYPVTTSSSYPEQIAAGSDGALWFGELNGNKIGRITTAGTVTNEYAIPTLHSYPQGIVSGADGALWFAECGTGKIGRITTSGSIHEYTLPPPASASVTQPQALVEGPDGAIWFTTCEKYLGRITTAGAITMYPISLGEPSGIAVGPDGAIWFGILTPSSDEYLARLSIDGSVFSSYDLGSGNPYPDALATGPDGAIWFTELNDNDVRKFQ